MATKEKSSFVKATSKFCIAGFFIPGFTAIPIFGIQMAIGLLGIECSASWTILWTLTTVGMVIAPVIFVGLMMKGLAKGCNLRTGTLMIFNVIEYTFLQASLATFFTNGQKLCYVTDGQNGLEFAFTGWMAMPFLIVLSFVFDYLRKRAEEKKQDQL